MSLLIGRRAVYTKVSREWNKARDEYVETKRELFHGTIAALVTTGEHHYPAVVMLYDDGSLRTHDIDSVTVEGASPEGPLR